MKKERIIAIMLLFILIGNQVLAAENILKKTETVYVNIDAYGKTEKINIYNDYQLSNQKSIIEYGDFANIQVLTGNNIPKVSGDKVEWNIDEDTQKLSYIAELPLEKEKLLPWKINLKYELNGVEAPASVLAGKSGLIKVIIEVCPNEEAPEYYKNQCMLEITSSFDMTNYLSVYSKDATEVTVGKTKQLMFIILPGQEKTITIEIGSEDFEMDALTFAMIPLQGEILEALEDLAKDKNDLEDAFDQTNKSLDVILNQMSNVTGNLETIVKGTENFQTGVDAIYSNSQIRNENIEQIKNSLEEVNSLVDNILLSISYAKERVINTTQCIEDMNDIMKKVSKNLDDIEENLDDLIDMAEDLPDDIEDLRKLLLNTKNLLGGLKKILGDYDAISEIDSKAIVKSLKEIGINAEAIGEEAYAKLLEGDGDTAFYKEVLGTSQSIGENLETIQQELEKVEELMQNGENDMSGISTDISKVQNDLNQLAKILKRLSENSEELPASIETIQIAVNNMQSMIKIFTQYVDDNISGDQVEITNALENTEQILLQLQAIQTTAQSMLSVLQSELKVLDNEIHLATNQTLNGTQGLLKNFSGITKESNSLKQSKNTIYQVTKNKVKDIENKTTLFNVNSEAKVQSFVSSKNEAPEKVQIFLKTKSIKLEKDEEVKDLETKEERVSFLVKIKMVFVKIWNFFINIF